MAMGSVGDNDDQDDAWHPKSKLWRSYPKRGGMEGRGVLGMGHSSGAVG